MHAFITTKSDSLFLNMTLTDNNRSFRKRLEHVKRLPLGAQRAQRISELGCPEIVFRVLQQSISDASCKGISAPGCINYMIYFYGWHHLLFYISLFFEINH